ncbi:hypothetical protein [Nonomuraea sp. KM88]|uniref:hypothetical protein n=1 Tax=Nonomuraea sp. KM88 TaxID=3457427 RepID=UPI003FCD0FE2
MGLTPQWRVADEHGNLIWISSAKPGRSSEITTARRHTITAWLRRFDLGTLEQL